MILGVTLARGGSKSIPHKNIIKINNKPLLSYTIIESQKCPLIDHYIINTDCSRIKDVAIEYNVEVQFGRPDRLSSDKAGSGETLKYVVERYEEENSVSITSVVELMATNPLKNSEDIQNCVTMLKEKNADSVIAVGQLYDHHPSRIKHLDKDGRICDFYPEVPESRRQDLKPSAFIRAGSIYAMTREQISSGVRYGGENSFAYVLPDERFLNIDEPRDILIAESILSNAR
jgi:CMP-N-acetylneuraminic acid synthetase